MPADDEPRHAQQVGAVPAYLLGLAMLSEIRQQAEQAAAACNHEQVAELRAREDTLRDQLQKDLESWQGTWSAE